MSDKSIMQNLYSKFDTENQDSADAIYYGLPAFLNFTLQNQVAAPFADPGQDAARLFSLVHFDRGKYLGQAVGQAFDAFAATGESPMRDAKTRDLLMRALAPRSLYQAGQVRKDETLRSATTGNPIVGLTPVERVMFGLGVNPTWAAKAYDVGNELWRDQEKMRKAVGTYGELFAQALDDRDNLGAKNVIMRAMYEGVDVSSVIKSGLARAEKDRQVQVERQFSPQAVYEFRKSGLIRDARETRDSESP
jgi:hypothetical protein